MRFAHAAAWPLAVLLALVSLGGLVLPSAYARETPAWTAQAIGQDWFDLLIAVPWLALCAWRARGGSYPWSVLLAGMYAYAVYEMTIYAFAVHFNALFLLYCATLGVAAFALIAIVIELHRRSEPVGAGAARVAGGFLVAIGSLFGAFWLLEDLPAIVRGEPSPPLVEVGLFTNPVHVIDLAFVLPAHVIVGVQLWRGHAKGWLFAPILLAFGIPMAASIAGMMIAIAIAGGAIALPIAMLMLAIAAASAAVLLGVFHSQGNARWSGTYMDALGGSHHAR